MTLLKPAIGPWLDRHGAAEYLGLNVDTLATMATRGTGPPYAKPTKRIVRYRVSDLDAWLESTMHTSSTQAEAKTRKTAKN